MPTVTRRLTTLLVVMLMATGATAPTQVAAAPRQQTVFEVNNVIRATVLLSQVYTSPTGEVIIACQGSGTLISADGQILTNAHVALQSDTCRSERLVVSLTLRIDEAPVPTYYAEVVGFNRGYDLAVLQIVQTLDNRPVVRAALTLPFVEVGDSDPVKLDDTIQIVGYTTPDGQGGGGAADAVRGTISGFTAEARVGQRAWLKTRAVIPGGMSGGGAYDVTGKLIGVPTVEPSRSDGEALDCRLVQDSNGDGRVDAQDTCIPINGFINALRPSRLARGLILAARLGLSASVNQAVDGQAQPVGEPAFSRLLFAPGVNSAGQPSSVVTAMPAGTTELYLFFDYTNMRDDMTYELRVTRDGVPDPTFSLAPATWNGGRSGMWYIGSSAQVWQNGVYEFNLFIDGRRATEPARITVGGAARTTPVISDVLFGVLAPDSTLAGTGAVLPVSNVIDAEFVFNNMTPDLQWKQVWYFENIRLFDPPAEAWTDGPNGKKRLTASAPPENPLQPGRYRLEIWLADRLAATSDFVMVGGQVNLATEIFSNLQFTTALDPASPDRATGVTFPNTIAALIAAFDWRDLAPGTPWTWRWTVDDNPLFEVTQPWEGTSTGNRMWTQITARQTIPDGSYRLDLIIGGVIRATATARVGLGQLPVTTFGLAEGVQLQGYIVDAETGAGIPGVSVIVLKVEYAVADFTNNMSEVYDMSLTDSQGQFTLSKLLARSEQPYSMIVLAKGYLPLFSDALEVTDETPSPLLLQLELNKD